MTKEELERTLEEKQEKLYESGVEERPTIMKQIRDEEESALRMIKWYIKDCEKKTGRRFPYTVSPIYAPFFSSEEVTCD